MASHRRRRGLEDTAAWDRIARELDWATEWTSVWSPDPPLDRWFEGGTLNLSHNCLDRHLAGQADKAALLWEGEPGDRRVITYRQLHEEVVSLARALGSMGIGSESRVALHLGWIPETVVAMLASARVGAIYTVIPTSLPAEGVAERLMQFSPDVLFTQDGAWRRGSILPLKARADEALSALGAVENTIVVRRTGVDVAWYEGDRWYHEVVSSTRPGVRPPEQAPKPFPGEQPLMSVPLANRKGKAASVVLSAANVLVTSAAVHKYGVGDGGVFWLPGDASWTATQVHGIVGPLAVGDTTVMFEGTLDTPSHRRAWDILERYSVGTLLLAPSLARTLRDWSAALGGERRSTNLRRCVTLGERSDPELARWLSVELAEKEVSIADAWGQVELGGIVRMDDPAAPQLLPTVTLSVVDIHGEPVSEGETGEVVVNDPWPGRPAGVFGDAAAAVVAGHWDRYVGAYATGDKALYEGPHIRFLGRMDQVVSISGHLVSLGEVRDIILDHPYVEAADVIETRSSQGRPALLATVVLDAAVRPHVNVQDVAGEILESVRETMGGLARPRSVLVLDRFGDELTATDRRAALAALAALLPPGANTTTIAWSQVLAASGHESQ
jgi:acetyl-CoA synthetase